MILFIDDEERWVKTYKEAIELSGYSCELITSVDDLGPLFDFENGFHQVDLIIIDIMMPPRKRYKNNETDEGMRTGELVIKEINEKAPEIPLIILTNKDINSEFHSNNFQYCSYSLKSLTTPMQLVDLIKNNIINK